MTAPDPRWVRLVEQEWDDAEASYIDDLLARQREEADAIDWNERDQ